MGLCWAPLGPWVDPYCGAPRLGPCQGLQVNIAAERGSIDVQHLGWRFSRGHEEFFAVIVEHSDQESAVAARKQRTGIDLSALVQLPSSIGLQMAPRTAEGWMLSALAAAMKMSGKRSEL